MGRAAAGHRRGRRPRRRGGRRRSAPSSTAWSAWTTTARSYGRRCCGTTPARPARPPTWSPRPAAPAAVGRGGRQRAGGRRSPSRSCAGWPSTSRTSMRATAAVCLPHDWLTWRLPVDGAGRAAHRPQRRQRHRLLVAGDRRVPARTCCGWPAAATCALPTVLAAVEPAGRAATGRRACSARAPVTTRPPPGRWRPARRRDRLARHLRHGVPPLERRDRRPDRHRGRLRRRAGRVPAAGLHAERGPGAGRRGDAARRRPRPALRAGAVGSGRARAGCAWCRTWRGSGRRTSRRRPGRSTA